MNFDIDINNLRNADMFANGPREICVYNSPDLQIWWINNFDGTITEQHRVPDVTQLLEDNQAEANNFSKNSKLKDMVKVASVPNWLVHQWETESNDDPEYIRRKLNDADNAKFRTNGLRL